VWSSGSPYIGMPYIEAEDASMIGRPCKPDNDLKGLWRTMFGTPFPACGMPEESEAAGGDRAASGSRESPSAAQDAKASAKVE
jgi:hypothetical protein